MRPLAAFFFILAGSACHSRAISFALGGWIFRGSGVAESDAHCTYIHTLSGAAAAC
jgi:hypothetical protein